MSRAVLVLGAVVLLVTGSSRAFAQGVIYVDAAAPGGGDGQSWATAFQDLQDGLDDACASGGEIWVAGGLYQPDRGTLQRTEAFRLCNGLVLLGGFVGDETTRDQRNWTENPTILSGDLLEDDEPGFTNNGDNAYHVVVADRVDSSCLIDGFVIEGGNASGSGIHAEGGGIRGEQSDLQISHCVFRANSAYDGGGVFFFLGNPTFVDCIIIGNLATNETGGIICRADVYTPITPMLINCAVVGNRAGARMTSPGVLIITIGSSMIVRNSILWGNRYLTYNHYPRQIYGSFDVAYSCVEESSNWPSGPGNHKFDPLFVNAEGADGVAGTVDDDLRIWPGSPCIDAGDSSARPPDRFDIDADGDSTEPLPFDGWHAERFYDDPFTVDGGAGSAPIVDMGPFEGPVLTFTANPTQLEVLEGTQETLETRPSRDPLGPLDVSVTVEGDPDIVVTPPNLQFDSGNWTSPQLVSVEALQDPDFLDGQATVVLSAPNAVRTEVMASELDDDIAPGTLFVDASASGANNGSDWDNAFTDFQVALWEASQSGGAVTQIWVADGTYTPAAAGSRGTSFVLQNNLALYGGFAGGETSVGQRDWEANPTVLSGDLSGNDWANFGNRSDNSLHVVVASAANETAILDGFVIRGGNANVSSNDNHRGGGLYMYDGNPTFRNCLFTDNESTWEGGGAHLGNFDPTFLQCTFTKNRSREGGGAWAGGRFNTGGSPVFMGCLFEDNEAEAGAGMMAGDGAPTIIGCRFIGNSTTTWDEPSHGGGLYLRVGETSDAAVIADCEFSGNDTLGTGRDGGGMYLTGRGSAILLRCTFINNESGRGGGGLSAYTSSSAGLEIRLIDCEFIGNVASAGSGGGADAGGYARLILVQRCTFIQNVAGYAGGLSAGGRALVKDCSFIQNVVTGNGGGAVGSQSSFIGCAFVENEAVADGGGAATNNGSIFSECTFRDNVVTGPGRFGGGLYTQGGGAIKFCEFIGNTTAGRGGGFAGFSEPVVTNSLFLGNTAVEVGGGRYGGGSTVNCAFSGNSSAQGGAIWTNSSRSKVSGCTLYANTASIGGGLYASRYADLLIDNTIFRLNQDDSGTGQAAQIAFDERASLAVNYNCVSGWDGSLGGDGNFDADPLFYNADGPDGIPGTADDMLDLADGSPCIDAASNLAVPPDVTDLDEDLDTNEPTPLDLLRAGRFNDDPDTVDTGLGDPPLVDMGSYEFYPNSRSYSCPADFNGDGIVNTLDFLSFLNAFSAGDPSADFNGDGVVNTLDFLAFLNAYSEGC